MDRGSFLGVLLGFLLLGVAIGLGPNPRIFFNPAGFIVVVGGIIAATLIRFTLDHVRYAFRIASRAFFTRTPDTQAVITQIVGLSQRARREGLINLESYLDVEGFLAQGLRMVVDRSGRDHIREVLAQELRATQERHHQGQDLFRFIALSAPSFGMVGTLIGMVQLFASIKDPSHIGGAMALSLLSTLYGAVIAYLLAIPIAGKLELRSREELQLKQIMMEGVLGIEAELNPSALEAHLNAFLAPATGALNAGGSVANQAPIRFARRKADLESLWLVTFADLMVQLMAVFALLYSFSAHDTAKLEQAVQSIQKALGVKPVAGRGDGILPGSRGLDPAKASDLEKLLNAMQSDDGRDVGTQLRVVSFRGALLFDEGSAALTPGSDVLLVRLSELAQRYTGFTLVCEGHAAPGEKGRGADALALSSERAQAVYRYLRDLGVDPQRITVEARGDSQTEGDPGTPEGRALQRRVVFRFQRAAAR